MGVYRRCVVIELKTKKSNLVRAAEAIEEPSPIMFCLLHNDDIRVCACTISVGIYNGMLPNGG